jgi:hypothetical protein
MTAHPELLEKLAATDDSSVRAVLQLRGIANCAIDAGEFTVLARRVLTRVGQTVGHEAKRCQILQNANSIILEADKAFVREMIKQPEIVSALPAQTSGEMFIPPKSKRPARSIPDYRG